MGEAEAVDETHCGGVGGVVATGSGDGWRYLGKPKSRTLVRCHIVVCLGLIVEGYFILSIFISRLMAWVLGE